MSGEPRELTQAEVIERIATIIRNEAYPEFSAAPPPEWAVRAAAIVIAYHRPMLRDNLSAAARREGWDAALVAMEAVPLYVGADAGATMRTSEVDRMRSYRSRVLARLAEGPRT